MWALQVVVALIILSSLVEVPVFIVLPWFGYSPIGLALLFAFFSCITLLIFCYYKACVTSPGICPANWMPPEPDCESEPLTDEMRRRHRTMYYCHKCTAMKPPRAHHCSQCNKCILRMDHHCPWINNCVGFYNYKYFILFLVYTVAAAVYTVFLVVGRIITWTPPMEVWETACVFALAVVVAFCAILVSCLLSYHLNLILFNYTTIEYHSERYGEYDAANPPPKKNKYDLGCIPNLYSVLGPSVFLWLLPTLPTGNGTEFPVVASERDISL
eukprot:gb/GEZN01012923.1/.p1 GENE.gb/GEZN01012923.1/~~gb/GEZN01012923.1/.p1  ORF type:complete len:271 (+),score=12.51 gb/GEZN01012923.1/:185-997(+)